MITIEQIVNWLASGNLLKFYTSRPWRRVRAEVMSKDKGECQRCKRRGKYSRAVIVHHVLPLRERPDLALSKHYTDDAGIEHRNLISLCEECHEHYHPERLRQFKKRDTTISERWD